MLAIVESSSLPSSFWPPWGRGRPITRCPATRSRSCNVRQVPQGGSAGPALQGATGHRYGNHRSRQTATEAGIRVHDAGRHRPVPEPPRRQEGNRDGDGRPQRRSGGVGGPISDLGSPVKFLFEVREPSETLRYVSESVMREVVGDRTVDEVITVGRQEIETEALTKMQALSTKYAMGISIDQVQLKNINPPQPVQESFNEVNQAQQEKEKLINEARRDYNKVIPLAEGEKDHASARPTATGSRGSMKRKAMSPGSAPCSRSTARPRRSRAAASISKPSRTSCRAYAQRSLSTNRRPAFSHC